MFLKLELFAKKRFIIKYDDGDIVLDLFRQGRMYLLFAWFIPLEKAEPFYLGYLPSNDNDYLRGVK